MPAIRHASKRKAPPAGFSDIEDSLLVFANKMKDAENAPNTAAPKHQALWPIFQVAHQRSRYVWELYRQEKISKQLYEWLCKNGYADAMLIAKWKKDSYAKVSFVLCGGVSGSSVSLLGGVNANGK
jgi:bud site selection protein 31